MIGYTFNLLKYTAINTEDIKGYSNYFETLGEKNKGQSSFIVFGEYDRLSVQTVTEFRRYRDVSSYSKNWLGKRQEILLYELTETPKIKYSEKKNKFFYTVNSEIQYKFIILSMFSLSPNLVQSIIDSKKTYLNLKKEIEKIIDKICIDLNMENIHYEIFGTFNSSEIAILWLSNQYINVLKVVEQLRNVVYTFKKDERLVFETVSSSIIANYLSEEVLKDVEGIASLEIILKNTSFSQNVKHYLEKALGEQVKGIYYSTGHISFKCDSKEIIKLFLESNLFNINNDDFKQNIQETDTRLAFEFNIKETFESKIINSELYKDSWDVEKEIIKSKVIQSISGDNADVQKKYRDVRNGLDKRFPFYTAGVIDTLDLLYSDFLSNIAYEYDIVKSSDFIYQFDSILELIQELIIIKKEYFVGNKFLEIYRDITSDFKQQILHLGESSRFNLSIPICHQRYSGHVDRIIHAYYGIIKSILSIAYSLRKEDTQSELIPLITVDTVPIVKSKLYVDSNIAADKRVIVIQLPGSILFDLPRGYCYLVHELFHYVVPKSRTKRNMRFGYILFCKEFDYYFKKKLFDIVKEDLKESSNDEIDEMIERVIKKFYSDYAISAYKLLESSYIDSYHQIIMSIDKEFKGKNNNKENNLLWTKYYEYLMVALPSMYNKAIKKDKVIHEFLQIIEKKIQDSLLQTEELDSTIFKEKRNSILESIKKSIKELCDCKDEKSIEKKFITENTENLNSELKETLDAILDALLEASVDIPMITTMNMDFCDYLFFFIQCLLNIGKDFDKLEEQDIYRIGIIATFFNIKFDNNDYLEIMKKLKPKYFAMYAKFNPKKNNFQSLDKQIEKWMVKFQNLMNKYNKELGSFQNIIYDICQDASIKQRIVEESKHLVYPSQITKRYNNILNEAGEEILKIYQNSKEKGEDIFKEIISKQSSEIFKLNVDIIYKYQVQDPLEGLYKSYKLDEKEEANLTLNYKVEEINESNNIEWEFDVKNLNDLINHLKEITQYSKRKTEGNKKLLDFFWYRGQVNSEFRLMPSIMREYHEHFTSNQKQYGSLAKFQREYFERFKFRADGAPEILDNVAYTISDYIGVMQHYSVPTNFLDWSEDVFTALYFALENELDPRKTSERGIDASLYILQPILYNIIRSIILESIDVTSDTKVLEKYKNATAKFGSYLPNLSVIENEELFPMFLLGKPNDELMLARIYGNLKAQKIEALDTNVGKASLPLAVLTSRLNNRLRAQSGNFLAFNLYSPAIETEIWKNEFEYLAMENIQKYYLKHRDEYKEPYPFYKQPFLYKINIKAKEKKEIANWLKTMGISTEKIYPELNNVGLRVKHTRS